MGGVSSPLASDATADGLQVADQPRGAKDSKQVSSSLLIFAMYGLFHCHAVHRRIHVSLTIHRSVFATQSLQLSRAASSYGHVNTRDRRPHDSASILASSILPSRCELAP